MNRSIRVRLDQSVDRSYEVVVRPGVLKDLPAILARGFGNRQIVIITDSNVRRLYASQLLAGLTAQDMHSVMVDIPAGERSKSSGIIQAVYALLLENGIRRESLVVALGGGVVGDVAGFVAATILRGIDYVQVPTTLLAQVDSSVGGKVGIDHPLGKNLIGAFHHPKAVYIDPEVIATLPVEEFRDGLAEVLKIALALDAQFFKFIERNASRVLRTNTRILSEVILRSVGLKAAIVRRDERESGTRKALNLGHTLGHAIEAAAHYTVKHGAAVAMGIVAESRIAVEMGLLKDRDRARVLRLIRTLKLPTRFPKGLNRARFLAAIAADKKANAGGAKFVLPGGIGRAVIGVEVQQAFITRLLA